MIDLRLFDEQREMVDGAAALLRECAPVSRFRTKPDEGRIHALLAEWGWFGAGIDDDAGGLGLGVAEEALLFQLAGRHLLSPSVLATTLAATHAADLRDALVAGDKWVALAMQAGGDEIYCFDREGAALLALPEAGRMSLYSAEAFTGLRAEGLDEALTMEKGRLKAPAIVVEENADRPILLVSAMLAGIAGAVSDLAIEYAKTREQFGQPIGAFQAIKHRCADMGVNAFAAEAQVLMAAACAAENTADAAFQIAAAARTAIAAARANCAAAIQVHGGMGFTADCDAHRFLKRAHVLSRLIGGEERFDAQLLAP